MFSAEENILAFWNLTWDCRFRLPFYWYLARNDFIKIFKGLKCPDWYMIVNLLYIGNPGNYIKYCYSNLKKKKKSRQAEIDSTFSNLLFKKVLFWYDGIFIQNCILPYWLKMMKCSYIRMSCWVSHSMWTVTKERKWAWRTT